MPMTQDLMPEILLAQPFKRHELVISGTIEFPVLSLLDTCHVWAWSDVMRMQYREYRAYSKGLVATTT